MTGQAGQKPWDDPLPRLQEIAVEALFAGRWTGGNREMMEILTEAVATDDQLRRNLVIDYIARRDAQ